MSTRRERQQRREKQDWYHIKTPVQLLNASTLDEWLNLYTITAVRAALLFFVSDLTSRTGRVIAMSVWDGFETSAALKEAVRLYPDNHVMVLGACRAIESHRAENLFVEATMNPEVARDFIAGTLSKENKDFLMAQLQSFATNEFPKLFEMVSVGS